MATTKRKIEEKIVKASGKDGTGRRMSPIFSVQFAQHSHPGETKKGKRTKGLPRVALLLTQSEQAGENVSKVYQVIRLGAAIGVKVRTAH